MELLAVCVVVVKGDGYTSERGGICGVVSWMARPKLSTGTIGTNNQRILPGYVFKVERRTGCSRAKPRVALRELDEGR